MKTLLSSLLLFCFLAASAQNYLGLEGQVPGTWSATNNALSISSAHHKMGTQSVQWDWAPSAQITISNPSGLAQACQAYKGGMILWIYNENAKDADLKFEYMTGNGSVQYYFNYHLNFTGWRACWIRFDEDMYGAKNDTKLTSMRITAPATSTGGSLFFDRMKFPSSRINDRVTPDAQLPYINPDMNANHWAALWHWESTYHYEVDLPDAITTEETTAFKEIRNRITTDVAGKAPSASRLTAIQNEFNALQIQRNGTAITGKAFVPDDEYVSANDDKRLKDLDDLVYDIAKAWHHNQETGFDQMFIDILDWLYDQGLTVGSGIGTNHHYGYEFRGFPKAIWLMQEALKDANKFQQAFDMIQYWTGVQEIRHLPKPENLQGIIDAWNTVVPGRLMAILLRDDSPELARDMQSFKLWMDAVMQPSLGTVGGFKPDGAGFHHGMIYANYLNGGYSSLGNILQYIGNTHYNVSVQSLANLKKGLIIHTWYANKHSAVNSVSGRHPIDQSISNGAINAFAYLAKASAPLDREAAAEYMRLTKYKKELYNEFVALGIQPAATPSGNKSVNYGALNLHRRDEWLVATKGFNNIVTGTEIYTSNNRYGRYQGYGGVQVLASGNPVSAAESGFVLEGWDWNRFPGATTIHLPFDKLEYSGSNLNDRSQTEAFAGACSLGDNGIFGMKLDENGYTNYTDDFVAHKSVFAFDNRIICLGSDINNSNSQNATETTLFQTHLTNTSEVVHLNDEQLNQFPLQRDETVNSPITLMDTKGNGYYIPAGRVKISKSNQESRHNQDRKVNYGNFATAWIDHGTSPTNAGYEYALLVQTSTAELTSFKADMSSNNVPYEVIRKDHTAHIVKDNATQTTGYVLFEAANDISGSHIKTTTYPCLVMVKEKNAQSLQLSMADPAINMEVPTSLTHTAKVSERKIQITLNGKYALASPSDNCELVAWQNNTTILEFTCIHGLPVEVSLTQDPPLLSTLKVDGAHLPNWTPATLYKQITLPAGHTPTVEAGAQNAADEVIVTEPNTYPGMVNITVTNSAGGQTLYSLDVLVADSHVEDFERFTEIDWVNTSFAGNQDITWFVDGKKSTHLGTGNCIYFYNNKTGVWSEAIPGGISALSFDVKDLWADGAERTLEVQINNQVVKTITHTGAAKYKVDIADLKVQGHITIAIQNKSATKCATAIDNISWVGYAPDRNAYLSEIRVNDTPLNNFSPQQESYAVTVNDTREIPVLAATNQSPLATHEIDYPSQIPGVAFINVVAEDGSWKTYTLNLDLVNAIPSAEAGKILTIYPNPVEDILYLESTQLIDRIIIYNGTGKQMLQQTGPVESVPVSHLQSGIYYLKVIMTQRKSEVIKFMKR
ncbi:MAG: T9SS type A sorting domain-containing protein [Marinilabiliaceae bacterium]|nr:T9SS type A sorting domain-containing protein [Marinilabiliaceae bacterium]